MSWGEWKPLPGYGQTTKERFSKELVDIWVIGSNMVPYQLKASKVERWEWQTFPMGRPEPCDRRHFIYTVDTTNNGRGHDLDLVDYFTNAQETRWLCSENREEVIKKALVIIGEQLKGANRMVDHLRKQKTVLREVLRERV